MKMNSFLRRGQWRRNEGEVAILRFPAYWGLQIGGCTAAAWPCLWDAVRHAAAEQEGSQLRGMEGRTGCEVRADRMCHGGDRLYV